MVGQTRLDITFTRTLFVLWVFISAWRFKHTVLKTKKVKIFSRICNIAFVRTAIEDSKSTNKPFRKICIFLSKVFTFKFHHTSVSLEYEVCTNIIPFKWINQLDAAINYRLIVCRLDTAQHVSVILLPIIWSLSTAAAASGLDQTGPDRTGPDRPRPAALLPPRSCGKLEAAAAVDRLLLMGIRMPETCWAVFKRQAINL